MIGFCLCGLAAGDAAAQPGGVRDTLPLPTARFSTGDSAAWAAPDFDDSRWATQRTGTVWQEQGYEGYHGYAWYRIHVRIPSSLRAHAFWKDSLRIFLAHVNDVDETFLNGVRIGKTGGFPEDPGGYKSRWPLVREYHLPLNATGIRWDQDNVLAVRVYDGGGTGGIFMGHPFIDMLEKIDAVDLDVPADSIRYGSAATVTLTAGNRFAVPVRGVITYGVRDVTQGKDIGSHTVPVTLSPFGTRRFAFHLPNRPGLEVHLAFTEAGSGLTVERRIWFPYTLTPVSPLSPRVNGPRIYGARPGSPFLYKVPVSGARPLRFRATGLPEGLVIDASDGIIRGAVPAPGRFPVTLEASNRYGRATAPLTIVIGDTLSYTPALGWNSWNCWGLTVDDEKVRRSAAAFVQKGLADHGWSYINIDDGWEASARAADGRIVANDKFPDLTALSGWLHARGLKFGIYSSPGPLTCGGFLGSYGHEAQDAATYAGWGIDYLKYDWCSYDGIAGTDTALNTFQKPYRVMQTALRAQPRDILYSLCQYGMKDVWTWGASVDGQSWRTTEDIEDTWESLHRIGFGQYPLYPYAGPGHWNDPDMLTVGWVGWGATLRPSRLTPDEQYTQVSLWSLLSAPLLLGCDLGKLDGFTLGLLTNDEVLAIDQDALGRQAQRVVPDPGYQVWIKPLADGSTAVGVFNMEDTCRPVRLNWDSLGLGRYHILRDVWRQRDLGAVQKTLDATLMPHGVLLVRLY
ncbi:glycohydrolase-like protein with He_PIG associated NEW1 domain [Dinghuibacter silviterrae]|uniref:Alpha-galactosidase n=1 Tax=Dinghuibacter silviterrae TaxID=1539049 RepID=A0A4R8DFN4_9BACT|nr:glycohydrolase-like protein with He_PIG associated NEW1 domain [Dinghuibacter silviterrae]